MKFQVGDIVKIEHGLYHNNDPLQHRVFKVLKVYPDEMYPYILEVISAFDRGSLYKYQNGKHYRKITPLELSML
jgi:hypothetical protein